MFVNNTTKKVILIILCSLVILVSIFIGYQAGKYHVIKNCIPDYDGQTYTIEIDNEIYEYI